MRNRLEGIKERIMDKALEMKAMRAETTPDTAVNEKRKAKIEDAQRAAEVAVIIDNEWGDDAESYYDEPEAAPLEINRSEVSRSDLVYLIGLCRSGIVVASEMEPNAVKAMLEVLTSSVKQTVSLGPATEDMPYKSAQSEYTQRAYNQLYRQDFGAELASSQAQKLRKELAVNQLAGLMQAGTLQLSPAGMPDDRADALKYRMLTGIEMSIRPGEYFKITGN